MSCAIRLAAGTIQIATTLRPKMTMVLASSWRWMTVSNRGLAEKIEASNKTKVSSAD